MQLLLFNFLGPELLILLVLGLMIIPFVFYLLSLRNTLRLLSTENQLLPPNNVWLLFIPLFGLIYHFIVVGKISDSLARELDQRNLPKKEARPAYNIGLAMCILSAASVIPVLGSIGSLGALVCWIVYWVKIEGYKNTLLGQVDIL